MEEELLIQEEHQDNPQEDITDPGLLEGMPKTKPESKQEGPPEGSPRWNEIYKKWKDNERQVTSLSDQLKESRNLIDSMRDHNRRLEESFTSKFNQLEQSGKENKQTTTKNEISDLRKLKAEALEEGNFAKAESIQDEIDDIRFSMFSEKIPPVQQIDEKKLLDKMRQENSRETFNRAASEFTSSSPWYQRDSQDYDPVMTAAAEGLDTMLSATIHDPFVRLKEVKSQIEERFNWKGKGTQNSSIFVSNSPNRAQSTKRTGKTNSLTPEEKRIAHKMFSGISPDPEAAYLKQLQMIESE